MKPIQAAVFTFSPTSRILLCAADHDAVFGGAMGIALGAAFGSQCDGRNGVILGNVSVSVRQPVR